MDLQTTTSGEHHLVVTFFEGKFSTTEDRDLYLMTNDDYIYIYSIIWDQIFNPNHNLLVPVIVELRVDTIGKERTLQW